MSRSKSTPSPENIGLPLKDQEYFGLPHISKVAPDFPRPVCQCCGKKLKLLCTSFYFRYHEGSRLTDLERWNDVREQVRKSDVICFIAVEWPRRIEGWDGKSYLGYMQDEDQIPLFCRWYCAGQFAAICYTHNKLRMVKQGRLLSRYGWEKRND